MQKPLSPLAWIDAGDQGCQIDSFSGLIGFSSGWAAVTLTISDVVASLGAGMFYGCAMGWLVGGWRLPTGNRDHTAIRLVVAVSYGYVNV